MFYSYYIKSKTQIYIVVCQIPNKEVLLSSLYILMLTNDNKEYLKANCGLWNVNIGRVTIVHSSDGS